MSLTKSDLVAIKTIVKSVVDESVDVLAQQTALGFNEVHSRIDGVASGLDSVKTEVESVKNEVESVKTKVESVKTEVESVKADLESVKQDLGDVKDTVGRIELQQRAEVDRADRHGNDIQNLKIKAGIA